MFEILRSKPTQPCPEYFSCSTFFQGTSSAPGQSATTNSARICAAEAALAAQNYVSALDVFLGMGLPAPSHIQERKQGRVDVLERVIQDNPQKLSFSMQVFHKWAQAKGLNPAKPITSAERAAVQWNSNSASPSRNVTAPFCVSPALSERKRENLDQRLAQSVFQILRDSGCSECGAGSRAAASHDGSRPTSMLALRKIGRSGVSSVRRRCTHSAQHEIHQQESCCRGVCRALQPDPRALSAARHPGRASRAGENRTRVYRRCPAWLARVPKPPHFAASRIANSRLL